MRKQPKYMPRVVPPLSDGRTIGVCKYCGKQHPPNDDIEYDGGGGCYDRDAVFTGVGHDHGKRERIRAQ